MPLNEIETHPFLHSQVDARKGSNLEQYKYLIVGTFPIYCLTESTPIEAEGILSKENWREDARFKFFYGSLKNKFWELFANAFNEACPKDESEAICLLNRNKFLISDAVLQTERKAYLASDLCIKAKRVLNREYLNLLTRNAKNLTAIFFTSKIAKLWFCDALGLRFNDLIIDKIELQGRTICLFVLMSPARSGRSVNTYLPILPLDEAELNKKNSGLPYASQYRERYWSEFLNMKYPC